MEYMFRVTHESCDPVEDYGSTHTTIFARNMRDAWNVARNMGIKGIKRIDCLMKCETIKA